MAKFILMIAFSVLVCDNIGRVLCASKCKTHADCKSLYIHYRCCGGSMILGGDANVKERSCWFSSCLYRYCANDSDCSDQLCCRSNKCVRKGCNGCAKNSDCNIGHVCCKNTLPLDQTVCGDNCINQTCNSNDDCAGQQECCRSGKCTRGCSEKCASDSECNLDEYCCNKRQRYWGDNCAKTCVGELCTTDRDCGARNECCISNKCVDRGCSGCITNSNCSTGHYCCKEGQSYSDKISVCSVNCIGKFCRTTKECGGPGETCGSSNKCAVQTSKASSTNSFPPWLIAVLTISLVVFFTAVGVLVAVFWYVKRTRSANAGSQAGTVSLQNTQFQGAGIPSHQQNTQFSRSNAQIQSKSPVTSPQRGNVFINPAQNRDDQKDASQYYNTQHEPFYNTLESTDTS